jgi:hypothetical protein
MRTCGLQGRSGVSVWRKRGDVAVRAVTLGGVGDARETGSPLRCAQGQNDKFGGAAAVLSLVVRGSLPGHWAAVAGWSGLVPP